MKHKILIVEDAKIIAQHLKQILENVGYDVVALAINKKQALDSVERYNPDIILMDIMLASDDDGIETMMAIQETKDIPVIYLTALTDRRTIERAKRTKPYGYIMKPFQAEQIVTMLEMALHKYTAENKLKESERKFRAAVTSISDSFIFLNDKFQIEFVNRAAEDLLGVSVDECRGKNFYEVVSLNDLETMEEVLNLWPAGPEKLNIPLPRLYLLNPAGKRIPIGDGLISKVYDYNQQLKGIVITFRDISEKLKKQSQEEEVNKKQLASMIEGQEKERSRIARELHDGLGQVLNGIKLRLRRVDNGDEEFTQLKNLIDEAIVETSRISENLHPSKLNNFDLSTCLMSLVNMDHEELNISFETSGVVNKRITMNVKVNLYRITQELIFNCIKHARAANLDIQLRGEGNMLELTVEDDGIGFDLKLLKDKLLHGHMGIQNIMDRVKIMNGKFEVESNEKLGTIVMIKIPY